jgi:hypothetical protein
MNSDLMYKLLRYLIQGAIIYLLFKYVPKDAMSDKEIILITSTVILAYAVIENIYMIYSEENSQLLSPAQCNAQCSIKENMASVSSSAPVSNIVLPKVVEEQKQVDQLTQQADVLQQQRDLDSKSYVYAESNAESNAVQSSNAQIKVQGIVRNVDGSFTITPVANQQAQKNGSREIQGVMSAQDELAFNYIDFNSLPVSPTDIWDSRTSMMPPAQWAPTPPHPPVCVNNGPQCPVCPTFTNGTYVELGEWDNSRRLTPPDNINTNFIVNKLNSGR